MEIDLTEREIDFLKQFAEKQYKNADDNVGTVTPIHVVERKHKVFVNEGDDVWVDADNEYAEFESFDELIEERIKCGKNLPLYDDIEYEDVNDVWIKDYESYCEAYKINAYSGRYIENYQPIAFFFILDEAKRYKNVYQKHNCEDCRIYTYGLGYSNSGDLPTFRALLMKMGKQLLKKENESNV